MLDLMQEQKKYLEARLKDCMTLPDLNKNQIKEYRKYLEMLAASKDANEYADKIAFSGDMFSISQAEQLDRYENFIKIRKQFGDKIAEEADQINLDAALSANSHMELYQKMTDATAKANEKIKLSRQANESLVNLIGALVVYKTSADSRKITRKTAVKDIWYQLKRLDPEITWEKLSSYPPYKAVIIFDETRLTIMKSWLMEVIS